MLAQVSNIWILSGTFVIGASAVALALYVDYSRKRELAYSEEALGNTPRILKTGTHPRSIMNNYGH